MNDTERKQIKPQLLKCAKENENKGTFTGYVIVSSVCRAAVERIAELEKENAGLKERLELLNLNANIAVKELNDLLTKAKEIIKNLLILKNDHYGNTKMEWRVEVTEQAKQFLKEENK